MAEKSTEDQIAEGMRLENFIKDDAVSGALSRLERRYYEEFKTSKNSEDRVRAWAKAQVLDEFLNELRGKMAAGERARITRDQKRPVSR